jgi:exocyst complex component 6
LAQDVNYLTDFVGSLENGQMLRENLDELQQTVNLMQSDNHDEFYDISIRNKKYGRVDPLNGPMLLEKYVLTLTIEKQNIPKTKRANI